MSLSRIDYLTEIVGGNGGLAAKFSNFFLFYNDESSITLKFFLFFFCLC